jgi:hypothetical protein
LRKRQIIVYLLGLTALLSLPVSADTVETVFDQANQAYQQRDFAAAIVGYVSILEQGKESAAVYMNLGNAYFKQGDLGRAVLNYLRARRLNPGDDDIAANLEFARSYTAVQMEGVELNPIQDLLGSIVAEYRLTTLAWIAAALFILFWGLMILRHGFGINGLVSPAVLWIVGLAVVTACSLTTFKYRHDYLTPRAVLVCDDCPVYTGPSTELDVELQAAPGLVVEIVDDSGDWYNVLFENKRRGWIHKDLVAEV